MSLQDAKDELINTLTNNAEIVTWAEKKLTVIEGQKEVKQISGSEYPVFILEMGDADLDAYATIGSTEQDLDGDLFEFSFGWSERDRTNLITKRLELVQLVKNALSANKKLNNGVYDTVKVCRLSGYQNDKTVFYPNHFMNFVVYIETKI